MKPLKHLLLGGGGVWLVLMGCSSSINAKVFPVTKRSYIKEINNNFSTATPSLPATGVVKRQPPVVEKDKPSIPSNNLFSFTRSKFFVDNDFERLLGQQTPEIVWEEPTTDPFSELIMSWNALRPSQGYMAVWVSLKYKGQWRPWQRLAQWGPHFQKTFVNKLDGFAHTKHCRAEMQRRTVARGFRIKVAFHKGAEPKNLKALFACCSRPNKLRIVRPRRSLPSVAVRGVPRQSQMVLKHPRCGDLCSPVSTSMIIAYFYQNLLGVMPRSSMYDFALDFASRAHDQGYLDIYGNWILNVAQAFDSSNGLVYFHVERLHSFYDLYHYLAQKVPVAVSVRRLRGGATPYANGHFMVVVGWNREKRCVLCLDPAFSRGILKAYRINDFLRAWSRSSNLAYVPMMR